MKKLILASAMVLVLGLGTTASAALINPINGAPSGELDLYAIY